MTNRKKLIRLTTHSQTLGLLKGQIAFLSKEMDVILVAKDTGNLRQLAEEEGVQYRDIDMHREISLVNDIRSLCSLIKLFFHERPDIVHANTPKGALLGMIAAWITRVPHRIYNVNGLRFETATGNFRKLLIVMERIACAFANKVIPQSNGVADVLRKEHITKKPLKVILNGSGNGVNIERFNPNQPQIVIQANEIRGDFKGITYVFVGRLVGDKGVNELVEAFDCLSKEFGDIRLNLVGPLEQDLDPLKPSTLDTIQNNNQIIAFGKQKDVRPYLCASDIFVLPSYREGFPNVVLEAGAMGLPVIVTDVNGATDAIIDGGTGYIIPKGNVEALYNAMKKLYLDSKIRNEMARKSRQSIASRFNAPEVWNALLKEYRSLL